MKRENRKKESRPESKRSLVDSRYLRKLSNKTAFLIDFDFPFLELSLTDRLSELGSKQRLLLSLVLQLGVFLLLSLCISISNVEVGRRRFRQQRKGPMGVRWKYRCGRGCGLVRAE